MASVASCRNSRSAAASRSTTNDSDGCFQGTNWDFRAAYPKQARLRYRRFWRRPRANWGSGTLRREFLYAADLADAIRFVLETPEEKIRDVALEGLINVGVGADLSINDLATLIQEVVGHEGLIEHDRTKPDGTPRKLVDTSRTEALGWQAQTPLREGIQQTYDWYRKHEDKLVAA